MNKDEKLNASTETLLADATNEIVKQTPTKPAKMTEEELNHFARKCADKFMQNKLHNFPALCDQFRKVNYLKQQQLRAVGDGRGWSDKKHFKHQYEIPTELYYFMTNMIYIDFWGNDNEKVWKSFLKQIMAGQDPHMLLRKVKMYYDSENNKLMFTS